MTKTIEYAVNLPLLVYYGNDIIDLDDSAEALKLVAVIKEKFVKEHHKRKIFYQAEKASWRTYVGNPRKEVTRKTKQALIDYLYTYYMEETLGDSSVEDVFNRRQEYRRNSLNRTDSTIDRDRQAFFRVFDKGFCKIKIQALTEEDISAYINKRSKELHIKERALQDAVRILNGVFDHAMKKDKIIKDNPVKRIDMDNYYQNCDISMKSSDEKIFTEDEIACLKDRICEEISENTYDYIGYAMLFSIETGVRVGEIPVLKWEDIVIKNDILCVHIHRQQRAVKVKGRKKTLEELPFTKNERRHPKDGRYFPVTDKINSILDEVRGKHKELGIESEYIFCREDGKWFDKDVYAQRLRRLCKRLGYDITNNHAFRMSLNSNVFIPNNIPVTQRAYLLGHSVETNERFYSHMKTDCLGDLKEVLNGYNHSNYAQSKVTPSNSLKNIVIFRKNKNPETPINTRHSGT